MIIHVASLAKVSPTHYPYSGLELDVVMVDGQVEKLIHELMANFGEEDFIKMVKDSCTDKASWTS